MAKEKLTIESSLERLEQISAQLSSGEVTVNDAVKLYKEAAQLLKESERSIKQARSEIDKIDKILSEADDDGV